MALSQKESERYNRILRNTTVGRFRRKTVTVHNSSNRLVRKETEDEGTERRM